jgi:hypothetical protein
MSSFEWPPSGSGSAAGVSSLNSLTGAVILAAGSGISLTPSGNTITVASTASALTFSDSLVNTSGTVTLVGDTASPSASQYYGTNSGSTLGYYNLPSPGTGTVTSVALSTPGVLYTVSGSPITTSGTLTLTLNTQTANTVFAGPTTGSAATPTFRALVNADVSTLTVANISGTTNSTLTTLSSLSLPYSQLSGSVPTWNQNTTGTAANITASTNSTLTTLSSLSLPYSQLSGSVPTWNQNTTGTAANVTATSNSTLTTISTLVSIGTITTGVWQGSVIAPAYLSLLRTINAQTGTTYTFALADGSGAGGNPLVTFGNSGATTVTVPTNASVAFPVGTQIDCIQQGAGAVTFAAAGGVTLNSNGGLVIGAQYVGVSLIQTAANTWTVIGYLT